jgi:nucleotide-binding universal stress UspA family protein
MLTELAAYGSEGLRRSVDDVIVATPGAPAVDMKLAEGDPVDLLVAASRDSDLLVCGTRGSGALAATLMRSVSSRLAHEAPCPLLAVPRGAPALCRDP